MAYRSTSRVHLDHDFDKLPKRVREAISNTKLLGNGGWPDRHRFLFVSQDDLIDRIKRADDAFCTGNNMNRPAPAKEAVAIMRGKIDRAAR